MYAAQTIPPIDAGIAEKGHFWMETNWKLLKINHIVKGYSMNVAQKICEKAKDLPEPLAREVLEFIERVSAYRGSSTEELKKAQEPATKSIWENKEDDIWNEL